MKPGKQKAPAQKPRSRAALTEVLDQLEQWSRSETVVHLIVSRGLHPLHVLGNLHESPLVGASDASAVLRGFNFHSLTGEIYVPLLPGLHKTARVESLGGQKTVVMEDRGDSLSICPSTLKKSREPETRKPDAKEIENASQQLSTWVAAQTPIMMAVYGKFFVLSIEGRLHVPTDVDRRGTFDFTAKENLIRSAVNLASAESVTMRTLPEGHVAIWVEGGGGRILFAEFHDKQAFAELLKASGGRVN